MIKQTLKLTGLTLTVIAFSAGSALAGNGKDCDHKKEAKVKTEATSTSMTRTDVMSTSTTAEAPKAYKVYSIEDATKICKKKAAKDMEACVAYQTGKKKAMAPKT